MDSQKAGLRFGLLFVVLFLVGSIFLISKGKDAVTMATEKKAGILTAEQISLSFEKVGGKLLKEAVIESQEVKKGDALLVLDSIDTDLALSQLTAEIARLDAQILQQENDIHIGYEQTATREKQAWRDIESQLKVRESAEATLEEKQIDYERKKKLFEQNAVSQSIYDNARIALDVARTALARESSALERRTIGLRKAERDRLISTGRAEGLTLDEIAQQRQLLENRKLGVAQLKFSRKGLEVQLDKLQLEKRRMTLTAPEDGKILKIIGKTGQMVNPNSPVLLMESRRFYYDIYLDETQIVHMKPGDAITAHAFALPNKKVLGKVRFIQAAPGYTALRMSREKGLSDLNVFQVRIYIEAADNFLPGMTLEVNSDEFLAR